MLNIVGTAKSKALIKKGVNMFGNKLKRKDYKSEKEFYEAKEELLIQRIGEYTANRMDNKALMGKAKIFIKDFWVQMKGLFGLHNKNDIAWMLSKKVFKGDIPKPREVKNFKDYLKTHYQVDESGKPNKENLDFKKSVNKRAHQMEKLSDLSPQELKAIREKHGLDKGFKVEDVKLEQLDAWLETLTERSNEVKKDRDAVFEYGKKYQVPKQKVRELVSELGVIDGDPSKLSAKNKETLRHIIKTYGKEAPVMDIAQDSIISLGGKTMDFVTRFARKVMPVYHILREYGGKPGKSLADRIIKFDVAFNYELSLIHI